MFMHGYPQCRLEASASPQQPNRRIMDWPTDVQALAHHLRLSRFAITSGSGGGPYALECAQALPQDMMSVVSVLAGAANWEDGAHNMPWIYRTSMLAVEHWPAGLRGLLTFVVWMLRNGMNT